MNYLIFDYNSSGHHLEYIHHIISYIEKYNIMDEFHFILAPDFKQKWDFLKFFVPTNCYVNFISRNHIANYKRCNRFVMSLKLSKVLNQYIKQINPDKILLIDLIPFLPFLPFLITKRCLINAIIYKIPRYRPQQTFVCRFRDMIMMKFLAKSRIFNSVFLLNDEFSPGWYNNKYNTRVFKYVPDPVNIIDVDIEKNEIVNDDKIVLVHGGGLGKRKGTLRIIEAIKKLSYIDKSKFQLRIIGQISDASERKAIINAINKCKESVDLVFIDRFVSFETLMMEIKKSDYVLIPYDNWEQSSGFLGYAAYFGKPVIGPNKGLLGNLIEKFNLGITIDSQSEESLKKTIANLQKQSNVIKDCENYVKSRSIKEFANVLLQ